MQLGAAFIFFYVFGLLAVLMTAYVVMAIARFFRSTRTRTRTRQKAHSSVVESKTVDNQEGPRLMHKYVLVTANRPEAYKALSAHANAQNVGGDDAHSVWLWRMVTQEDVSGLEAAQTMQLDEQTPLVVALVRLQEGV